MCNVSLISPIFALIIMFLESLGSLHIFAILGSILLIGGSRKGLGMVPAFLKFQIAAGDWSCFIFSNQDGLFVISCSLAALFQTTRMRMPHMWFWQGWCFALLVEEWHVAHFCLLDVSKYSANILVVSAGYVKSIGAVFHPVKKQ